MDLDAVQFGLEFRAVGDVFQVGPLAFDVPEQGLDRGLITIIPNSG